MPLKEWLICFDQSGIIRRQHNPELVLEGFLLTMYDSRLSLSRQVEIELREAYGGHVFNSVISP